jgi:hypothetical protein
MSHIKKIAKNLAKQEQEQERIRQERIRQEEAAAIAADTRMRKSKKKLAFTRNLNLQISLKNNKLRKIKKELKHKKKMIKKFQSEAIKENSMRDKKP